MTNRYSFLIVCIVIAFVILVGCSSLGKKDRTSFNAVVLDINQSYLLVQPVKGSSELNSADQITISVSDAALSDFRDKEIIIDDIAIGDNIQIVYDGQIAESYPAQIHKCYSIKLLK
ncbi:MAG: hypothetical protein PHP06_07565 [Clostridia bacterium]|nr:hypothetical protein [Clostridia bacterium]